MTKKLLLMFTVIILICMCVTVSCYAITEADVQSAVESSSKEEVSGSTFIWFLCAIAFMKVSQKIDSFMNSLGISVGRTGGSLMAEAMIAGRAIGSAFQIGGKFAGFGRGNSIGNGSNPAGGMGLFGGIGRRMTNGATNSITQKNSSRGLMASIGRKLYQNSVGKGGSFATGVISSVARGEINKMGSISGSNGKEAMESYFGYKALINEVDNGSISGADISGGNIPSFSDIEMGGGRITGIETSAENPNGIQFAMYDSEKYTKPDGKFETVTAVDNSKWYKQYATSAVEKTPYMAPEGKIRYNEKIVQRIPKAPMRKDKM